MKYKRIGKISSWNSTKYVLYLKCCGGSLKCFFSDLKEPNTNFDAGGGSDDMLDFEPTSNSEVETEIYH